MRTTKLIKTDKVGTTQTFEVELTGTFIKHIIECIASANSCMGTLAQSINVTLTDEQIQQLIDLVRSLEKLDISGLTDTINSVGDWFKSVGEAISDFFKSIAATYVGPIPIQVIYIIIVVAVTAVILNRTQLGRHILATGGNMQAAAYSGVNTKKVTLFVFVYCSLLASLAGIISASRLFSGTHTAGESAEMDAIAAVVLGGTSMSGGSGSVSGTVFGVLIIAILNNVMNLYGIDASWQYIVKGIVIMIAVFIDYFKSRNE